jgi:high-affinity iron transporter
MDTTSTIVPYFLYSSGILLREGLEALLVIIALVAATREAGQESRARDVYAGGLIAVGVSIVLAWVVNHLIGDNTSDTLEGIFQLTAAATLFYVSSWITAKSQAQRWNIFIKSKIDAAKRSRGPSIALGLTAFLAVMREGAETIVFFQALVSGATERAERHAVFLGVIAGAIGLTVIFLCLRNLVSRIPIGAFFTATSVLLYTLAVVFVGQGIASFQESGVMGASFINHLPTLPMLGFFPTVQTVVAQGILILLAAAALVVPMVRRPPAADNASVAARGQEPHPHTT